MDNLAAPDPTKEQTVDRLSQMCCLLFSIVLMHSPTQSHAQETSLELDLGQSYTNSVGMPLNRIPAGSFVMGSADGDYDESPVHEVILSKPFYMAAYEVTNEQYEQFDPVHRELRGKLEFSRDDDEAAVFVSWHEAVAFTEWLSEKEGLPYRLPTEAEWEYSARANTTTAYYWGDSLPTAFLKNARDSWYPHPNNSIPEDIVPLHIGQTLPNRWGLYDMHGNVQEWVQDWFGSYSVNAQADPVGRADGVLRVTRGGSHSQQPWFLRSANRGATIPEDKTWLIGFRVVLGELPSTEPLPPDPLPCTEEWSKKIDRESFTYDPTVPYFKGPTDYQRYAPSLRGPLFTENHGGIEVVETRDGDLLAHWSNYEDEGTRESDQETSAASRLFRGASEWTPACVFWEAPDRWGGGGQLASDKNGKLYHSIHLHAGGALGSNAVYWRTSDDNGYSWTRPKAFWPEHGPIFGGVDPQESGYLEGWVLNTATPGSAVRIFASEDMGETWNPADSVLLAGNHSGAVELKDGRLLQIAGRGIGPDALVPRAIKRISSDNGKTWEEFPTEFPRFFALQMSSIFRLQEGPIAYLSYADDQQFKDDVGDTFTGSGLFVALSYDEGESWPVKRLLADDGPPHQVRTVYGQYFILSPWTAEPSGYVGRTQASDGIIHFFTSANHYAFNLAWIESLPSINQIPLLGKANLTAVVAAKKRSAGPEFFQPMWYTGIGISEPNAIKRSNAQFMTIDNPTGSVATWRADLESVGKDVSSETGFTVEFKARVEKSEKPNNYRGLCVRLHLPAGDHNDVSEVRPDYRMRLQGPEDHDAYEICLARDAIYHYKGKTTHPFALNLDNHSAMHTYRIAVDRTRLMRVFRDGELVARLSPHSARTAARQRVASGRPAQHPWPDLGSFLEFGTWGPAEVDLEYVAWDLDGAFKPMR